MFMRKPKRKMVANRGPPKPTSIDHTKVNLIMEKVVKV